MPKAVLVEVTFMHRLIVPDDFDLSEGSPDFFDKLQKQIRERAVEGSIGDFISEIREDEECPYGTFDTDKL